jgi:hypothetical protein
MSMDDTRYGRLHPTEEERRGFEAERRDDEERERRRRAGEFDSKEPRTV